MERGESKKQQATKREILNRSIGPQTAFWRSTGPKPRIAAEENRERETERKKHNYRRHMTQS